MSIFQQNFIMWDYPQIDANTIDAMNAAGFKGSFANVRDYPPAQWETIRQLCKQKNHVLGCWGRTSVPNTSTYDPNVIDLLVQTADMWQCPLIVNSEKELDGTGSNLTALLRGKIGTREAAISMQPFLFYSTDWKPLADIPFLLQIFPAESEAAKDPMGCQKHAWDLGVKCVYFTFGTYSNMTPATFNLKTPYSLFTGNACGGSFAPWAATSTGFVACKPTNGGTVSLSPALAPYTGPYAKVGNAAGFKSKGPTVEALKRAMGHIGLMPWREYDQIFNDALNSAMVTYKRNHGLIGKASEDGSYGKGTWQSLLNRYYTKDGQQLPVFDSYSQKLLQDENKVATISEEFATIRKYITEFWTIAIQNAARWHYNNTIRPLPVDVDPANGGISDCSMMVIQAHHYAGKKSGIAVPDPAKQGYTGFGNTDEYEDQWPHVWSPFKVGDLAHFANPRHVIECIKPGDRQTAHWGSNGSEAAPELVSSLATYRPNDFMFVVRPALMA